MLAAIDAAASTVVLEVYIIELDTSGHQFVDALIRAKKRGCKVLVLVDYVGIHLSVVRALKAGEVTAEVFLPPIRLPFRARCMNLRNHPNLLICDVQIPST